MRKIEKIKFFELEATLPSGDIRLRTITRGGKSDVIRTKEEAENAANYFREWIRNSRGETNVVIKEIELEGYEIKQD